MLLSFFCERPEGISGEFASRVISMSLEVNLTLREFAREALDFVQDGRASVLATSEAGGRSFVGVLD